MEKRAAHVCYQKMSFCVIWRFSAQNVEMTLESVWHDCFNLGSFSSEFGNKFDSIFSLLIWSDFEIESKPGMDQWA